MKKLLTPTAVRGVNYATSPLLAAAAAAPEPPKEIVPAAKLLARPAPATSSEVRADRVADFASELRAGALAVRLGKVKVDEALRRLKEDFPREARAIGRGDLLS